MRELRPHQEYAVEQLGNGKVLWGGVGTGKSATAMAYYRRTQWPRDCYVITTAKKRDSLDWEAEAAAVGFGTERLDPGHGVLVVDSWNNIGSYTDVRDAFFIFDEQRLVGNGSWVKSFHKIVKGGKNNWILLSATPGDTWLDYAPIFIANGFVKNITEFKMKYVMYEPYSKYPKIRFYLREPELENMRNEVLVEMPFERETERYVNYLEVGHDAEAFKQVYEKRWNVFDQKPIKDVAEMFRLMRKVVNGDYSRLDKVRELMKIHPKLIIFYNFNYELDILRSLALEVPTFEWNGHVKDDLPDGDRWVYLVQYVAGAEGWNCTTTDAMVLYSMTYSYKNFEQAQGRIDRLDTPFKKLYYYVFVSNSVIDRGIKQSLMKKKSFNEKEFITEFAEVNYVPDAFAEEEFEICQI